VTCGGLGAGAGADGGAGVDETEGLDSTADWVFEETVRTRTLALGANLFFDLSGEWFVRRDAAGGECAFGDSGWVEDTY